MNQIVNTNDQIKIYKHLLQEEKIKNKELEECMKKFKINFNEMPYKTLATSMENVGMSISKPNTANNSDNNRAI